MQGEEFLQLSSLNETQTKSLMLDHMFEHIKSENDRHISTETQTLRQRDNQPVTIQFTKRFRHPHTDTEILTRDSQKSSVQKNLLFFFDNITYRRAIGEREIKYHFISRCSKGTPLAQRAIKLTLLTAHYFIAR